MKVVARLLVSVGVLAALLLLLPAEEIWRSLRRFDPGIWAGVLIGFLAGHCLGATKWRLLVGSGGARLGVRPAISYHAGGLFTNLFLPTIVGGDVLRATLASRDTGSTEAVVMGSLADRVVDVLVLGALIAAGGLATGSAIRGGVDRPVLLGALGAVGLGVLAVSVLLNTPLETWPARVRRPVGRTIVALRRMARNPGTAVAAVGLSLAMQAGFVLLNAWIGAGIGIDVPLETWFLVWPLAKGAGMLPVSVGGFGVRDATLGALLVPFGVGMETGVAASFVWQSVLIAGGLIAGAVWRVTTRSAGDGQAPSAGSPARSLDEVRRV